MTTVERDEPEGPDAGTGTALTIATHVHCDQNPAPIKIK